MVGATGISSAQSGPVGGGRKAWTFSTDGAVQSSPTVVDGTVYVGSDDKNLYSLDAADGTKQWNFNTDGEIYSSPAVVENTVYIASEAGTIFAVDAANGSQKWKFETGKDINSSPTVAAGTVYIGSGDQNVYALSASDGSEQWDTPFSTGGVVDSSPTVVDGTVYIGSSDNNVYAIDAAEGTEQWKFSTGGSVISSPTVANGTVFAGSYDRNVYAITDGSQKWKKNLDSSVYTSPTVANGAVYVADYSFGTLFELDTETGSRTPIAPEETSNPLMSSPTVANGIIYIGDGEGVIYAFDPDAKSLDQIKQWQFETGKLIESSPTVVDGTVYVGSNDGTVYALNADITGASSGTRVNLGTLGHHFKAAESDSSGTTPEITLDRDTLKFGATILGAQPKKKFTITNTGEKKVTITPKITEETSFIQDSWIVEKFESNVPPFEIPAGETVPVTLKLDATKAFERLGSDATFSIPFHADRQEVASLSVEAPIIGSSDTLTKMSTAADRTSKMFSKGNYTDTIVAAAKVYVDVAQITYELAGLDYQDAAKELFDLRDNWTNFRGATALTRINLWSVTDSYESGYSTAKKRFETAATALEGGNNEAAAKAFNEALNILQKREDEWHKGDKETFRERVKLSAAGNLTDDIVEKYTKSIEALVNVTSIRTSMLSLTASPVNTTVTDPEGRTVGPGGSEIPNSSYNELQLEGADSTEELIFIQDQIPGSYQVQVEPEPDAEPTETYTIAVRSGEQSTQIANEEQVQDIPSDGYSVTGSSPSTSSELPTEPGEPTFQDVLGVIKAYNTGETYNGVEVSFQDVLRVIRAYNRG
ncbi:hypothetical protein GCM10027355_36710 [Haloplanus salinarum]